MTGFMSGLPGGRLGATHAMESAMINTIIVSHKVAHLAECACLTVK